MDNYEHIKKEIARLKSLIAGDPQEKTKGEAVSFVYEFYGNLSLKKDFESMDYALRLILEDKDFEKWILLPFATITFPYAASISSASEFLDLVSGQYPDQTRFQKFRINK